MKAVLDAYPVPGERALQASIDLSPELSRLIRQAADLCVELGQQEYRLMATPAGPHWTPLEDVRPRHWGFAVTPDLVWCRIAHRRGVLVETYPMPVRTVFRDLEARRLPVGASGAGWRVTESLREERGG